MIAAVRSLLPPPADPRVAAERSRTLLARATACCWVVLAIIPFTIIIYDLAFFPAEVGLGAIAAAVADAAILLLLLGLRRRMFQWCPWLPVALLGGVICNATEAANLVLTGGPVESGFFFPYLLISFGIAIFFPAPILAVIATAALLPLGYGAVALVAHVPLGGNQFVANLMLLVDSACITCIGNKVVTNLFLREVRLRIDLEAANAQLREVDRLKSDFFANVSHELRTPLTLILAPAASLMRGARGKMDASQRGLVETITRNATRLLQLINDLLLLAKLDAGEPRVTRLPVDVGAAVRRIASEAQPFAESLDLRIDLDVGPGPFLWSGDERHLERIALNLVSNACKFSLPGGVVHVAAGSEGDEVWLRVTDHGIGIAPQDLEKIFDRFVQVESSSNRRFEGTGIGLSIVKQLVTLHGGTISVQGEPSRGSSFHVRLPTGPREAPPADEPARTPAEVPKVFLQPAIAMPLPPRIAAGSRLVIVEDNTDLLTYLTQELGRYYRISPFADSSRALRSCLDDPPDLIVSDIMMPGLDGIALAIELAAPRVKMLDAEVGEADVGRPVAAEQEQARGSQLHPVEEIELEPRPVDQRAVAPHRLPQAPDEVEQRDAQRVAVEERQRHRPEPDAKLVQRRRVTGPEQPAAERRPQRQHVAPRLQRHRAELRLERSAVERGQRRVAVVAQVEPGAHRRREHAAEPRRRVDLGRQPQPAAARPAFLEFTGEPDVAAQVARPRRQRIGPQVLAQRHPAQHDAFDGPHPEAVGPPALPDLVLADQVHAAEQVGPQARRAPRDAQEARRADVPARVQVGQLHDPEPAELRRKVGHRHGHALAAQAARPEDGSVGRQRERRQREPGRQRGRGPSLDERDRCRAQGPEAEQQGVEEAAQPPGGPAGLEERGQRRRQRDLALAPRDLEGQRNVEREEEALRRPAQRLEPGIAAQAQERDQVPRRDDLGHQGQAEDEQVEPRATHRVQPNPERGVPHFRGPAPRARVRGGRRSGPVDLLDPLLDGPLVSPALCRWPGKSEPDPTQGEPR
ncbi:MAG: hypothetical protein NVS4B10_11080 [Myxococcales bacterium]